MHRANSTSKSSLGKAKMHHWLGNSWTSKFFCTKPSRIGLSSLQRGSWIIDARAQTTPFLCCWTRGQANKRFYLWPPSTFHKSSLMCMCMSWWGGKCGLLTLPPTRPPSSSPSHCTMGLSPRITYHCINSSLNPYPINETPSYKLLTQMHKLQRLIWNVLYTPR